MGGERDSAINRLTEKLLTILRIYEPIDWDRVTAGIWEEGRWHCGCVPYLGESEVILEDLLNIDDQKEMLLANTEQFINGLPSNNALLWGARGTGKSSLIHALLNRFHANGLRVLQVSKDDLSGLSRIMSELQPLPYKFILLCDDLSFEASDPSYKAIKSALDGSIVKSAENVLIYATSNRRHLLPEEMSDNLQAKMVGGQLHESDAVEEKISLSDRFGLWLSFYSFRQDDYLTVVHHWIKKLSEGHKISVSIDKELDKEAVRWALARGVRSGRTAHHFARHLVGKVKLSALKSGSVDQVQE
jgi:predicted AAA+ superfamily ATPase